MINMITNRCWIATLMSVLLMTTFYVSHERTPTAEKTDLRGNDVSEVEITGPVPDLDDSEAVVSESTSVSLVSVIESPYAGTFTSQPIRTANLPQAGQQETPPVTPTIQKPVPPNYQTVNPSPFEQPIADDDEDDKDLDVLMRGPLHEAYAEVYQHDPKPSVVINRQPPEPIDELPPEFKPDGENVEWIPGYWAWDDQRTDFIWISGVWRDIPPGQRWVPGYWQTAGAGFRWVSGFWISDQQAQVNYLPQPPESLDNGPAYPAPSDDHYYAPGNWVYQNNTYVWQSGYWAPRVAYRVWIPARYIWTPNGCVYRPGFWDYEFDQRGVLFAPVCFNTPVYRRVQYCYQPRCVINTNVDFMAHLFVRPSYCHYYFGDWYAPRYVSQNFYPWSNYGYGNLNFRAYDPLFSYYRCRSTRYNNVQALGWVQNQFSFYFQYQNYRPRHTYRGQREYVQKHNHDRYGRDAVRRASYGERYDKHVNRERQGKTRGYKKVGVSDRIDSLAVSREISRRRSSQGDRLGRKDGGQRKQAKLDLPKTRPTSVKRASVQLANDGRNRQKKSDIRIPDDVRRKFEGFEKQQAEKRKGNLSTTTRNPERKNGTKGQANTQPKRTRPQVSRQPDQQSKSAAKQPGSARIQQPRKEQKIQGSQARSEQRSPSRDPKRGVQTDQRNVVRETTQRTQRKPAENVRAEQKQSTASRAGKQQQRQRSARNQEAQRTEASREMQKQRDVKQRAASEQNRKKREATQRAAKQQTDKIRADQQQAAVQKAKQNLNAQRRVQQQKSKRAEGQRQRDSQQLVQRQREAQQKAQQQRGVQPPVQRQRETQQKAQQQRESQQQIRRQRDAQQQAQRQREAQQKAQQQRDAQQKARRQLDAQQKAQQQRKTQQKAQNQRGVQQPAQRQRGAQQQAQRQRDAQIQAQRQRDSQKRAQQQRDAQIQAQRQRDSQQQAQRQRETQQKAQRQRESQQRAQRESQQRAQRESQQRAQRESQQRAQRESQQRAQRESQQRAQREAQKRAQRESQQRAQRESQKRAQRDAARRQNSSKRKKK